MTIGGPVCKLGRVLLRERVGIMAKIIEFYVPSSFRKKATKWTPPEQRGIVIPIQLATKEVGPSKWIAAVNISYPHPACLIEPLSLLTVGDGLSFAYYSIPITRSNATTP